jgi:hypothetical protein
MTKSHLRRFYGNISGENIDERALLIVDSWTDYKDLETMKFSLPSKRVDVLLISERTTNCIQPLDLFFFRKYTIYVRRIEGHVRVCLHDSGIKLHNHSIIMKMHSVVHNQLGAPSYASLCQEET